MFTAKKGFLLIDACIAILIVTMIAAITNSILIAQDATMLTHEQFENEKETIFESILGELP